MRVGDTLFLNPIVQPLAYQLHAGAKRALGVFRQRSGAVLRSESPVLLIVGCGRSGNTLLRRTLMERGSIYIPPESYVWASQVSAFLQSASLSWADQVALLLAKLEYMQEFETFQVNNLREFALMAMKWQDERRSLGGLILGLYSWLGEQRGITADWVGDKTPVNLARIGLISSVFPQARYIYVERDPIDVAVSYRAAGLYRTLEEGAKRWKLSRQAWLRFRRTVEENRRVEVRYDELVALRETTVDTILATFEIAVRTEPLDVTDALGDVLMREHHINARLGVRMANTSKARSTLTKAELVSLRSILGDEAVRGGYEAI